MLKLSPSSHSFVSPGRLLLAFALMAPVAPLLGQGRSAVSSARLDAAVSASPTISREALHTFLGTAQSRKVAGQMGVDIDDLASRAGRLNQGALDQLAQRAGVDDRALAGGRDTIIISTTAIIIGLLILILLTD